MPKNNKVNSGVENVALIFKVVDNITNICDDFLDQFLGVGETIKRTKLK